MATAGFEQAALLEQREHGVEQEYFGLSGHKAVTKLTQHRGVEAGVGQLQGQGILPGNAVADGIGGLPIRKAFKKLQH